MVDHDQKIWHSHWFYLFHSLLLLLILFPYLDPEYSTKYPWAILMVNSVVILTIIYTVSPNIRGFLFGMMVGSPAIISFWFLDSYYAYHTVLFSTGLLYIYAICMTIKFLIRSNEFNLNQLFAATSTYILMGLTWTVMFQVIELVNPGSFYTSDEQNINNILSWSDFIYYSFTTLTTLGYGDITPVNSVARSLSILEAITGVIFIPVIISGIVSILITKTLNKRIQQAKRSN
ncbi:MAG: ion channel [Chlamydiota bacterium]|nr:ion channel [Chlamydiota bacterium]